MCRIKAQGSSAAAGRGNEGRRGGGPGDSHSTVFPKSRLKPAQRQLEDGAVLAATGIWGRQQRRAAARFVRASAEQHRGGRFGIAALLRTLGDERALQCIASHKRHFAASRGQTMRFSPFCHWTKSI